MSSNAIDRANAQAAAKADAQAAAKANAQAAAAAKDGISSRVFVQPKDMTNAQKVALTNQAKANGTAFSLNPSYQAYAQEYGTERYDPNLDYFAQRTQHVTEDPYGLQVNPAYIAQPVKSEDALAANAVSQDALMQQQGFLQALGYQNGIQNQSNVFGQMQGVANGTGPNPAMAALQQQTGQNMANQAAMMGSQRGGSANVGLLARQIAQQQAATQQQGIGQAATLQAQQQLGALNQMGGIAQNQIANQAQAGQFYNQSAQAQQAMQLNALNNQNSANVAMQSNINNGRVGLEGGQVASNAAVTGGLISGVGAGLAVAAKSGAIAAAYDGGMIESYAGGGPVSQPSPGRYDHIFNPQLANGGMLAASGGPVRGGRAPVRGDNPKNDTVPAMLSPKEIVIPRSITMGANAPQRAAEFVAQVLARQGKKK